ERAHRPPFVLSNHSSHTATNRTRHKPAIAERLPQHLAYNPPQPHLTRHMQWSAGPALRPDDAPILASGQPDGHWPASVDGTHSNRGQPLSRPNPVSILLRSRSPARTPRAFRFTSG